MKANFSEVFEDVTKLGCKIPKEQYLDTGDYPIIDQGQKHIAGYSNNSKGLFSDVPAIIFGDHTRIIKYVDMPCFLGADGVKLLHVKDKDNDVKYLYYALCNARIPDTGYNRHFKWLKEIEIPLPPLPEQRHIAAGLDKVSELIALRKRQLDLLDEMVKARFVEMFGDLVVNEKGWILKPLNDVCDVRDGTHDSPKYVDNGYPLLTSKNFTQGFVDFTNANLIDENDFNSINKRSKVDVGDIVMPMIGTIGSPVIIYTNQPFAIKNVALIKFSKSRLINIFVKEVLSSRYFYYRVQENNRGNAQKFIALGDIRRLLMPIPPIELQNQFAEFVKQVEKSKATVQQGLDRLNLLKSALMQEYFG